MKLNLQTRSALRAALTMVLCAVFSGALAGSIPVRTASEPKVLWRMVMEEFYGPYDRHKKCWVGRVGSETLCMRPHRLDQTVIKGVNHYFLVMGGSKLDDSGELQQSHADSGVLGLVIFKDDGQFLRLVAKNDLHTPFGSFGTLPDEDQFTVREIGPNDTYGWVATGGWMGQGLTISSSDVFAAIGDTIASIGSLPNHFDNNGNCEDDKVIGTGEPCSDYSFTFMFDSLSQNERFYPAVLKLTGTREGKFLDQNFITKFDPNKMTYGKINGLPKEFVDGI